MKIDKEKVLIVLSRKNKTLSWLTDKVGYSRVSIYSLFNAKNNTPKTVCKLAGALGVDVEEILVKK